LIFATATILYIALTSPTSASEKENVKRFETIAYVVSVGFISALNGYLFFQVYCLRQFLA